MTENQPITAAELAELRVAWSLHLDAGYAELTGESDQGTAKCLESVPRLLDEIERLRAVIRRTHTTHCTDWPTHSPWCLLYEIEP